MPKLNYNPECPDCRREARAKKKATKDPLKPAPALLVKLGSIAVHSEEFFSPRGHPYDKVALESLLTDSEVKEWIAAMDTMALLPKRR